eukprot:262237-Pelagomonas_calceolata.AAC.1
MTAVAVREEGGDDGELSQPLLPTSTSPGPDVMRAVPGDHHLALRPAISSGMMAVSGRERCLNCVPCSHNSVQSKGHNSMESKSIIGLLD